MDLSKLGYTEKWIARGFLTEEQFRNQLEQFNKGENTNTEHYRYATFKNWLASKTTLTDKQVAQYIKLAREDKDLTMAGSAVKDLYCSPIITNGQFDFIGKKLPHFGSWTRKLIVREVLLRRLESEVVTDQLLNDCIEYKKEFKDNRPLITLISKAQNPEMLSVLLTDGSGKQIRTLVKKRLNKA